MSRSESKKRIQSIDAIRGIAAIGVVIFHFTLEFSRFFDFSSWSPPEWIEALRYGPHLFYVISGFVIFMSIDRALSGSYFIKSRLIRLMPSFWVALFATSLVTYLWGPEELSFSWADLASNIFFLQGLLGQDHVDRAYWSLLVEMAFYLLAAFFVFSMKLKERMSFVLWTWFILSVILMYIDSILPTLASRLSTEVLISGYSVYFIVGISFYIGFKNGKIPLNLRILLGLSIFIIAFGNPLPYGFSLSFAIFVLWLAIEGKLNWLLINPLLLWLGSISYPLYLIHQNIGITVMTKLIEQGASDFISILSAIALSLLMAQLLLTFIEKPSRKWLGKRFLDKKNAGD